MAASTSFQVGSSARITDLSIPRDSLDENEKVFREFYLVSSESIWGVDVHTDLPNDDLADKKVCELFTAWKKWCGEMKSDQIERVKKLTNRIKCTSYATEQTDNKLTQVWKRFLITFKTLKDEGELSERTLSMLEELAKFNPGVYNPSIPYGKEGCIYTGGPLPVGLLCHAPYAEGGAGTKEFDPLEFHYGNTWRHVRFMQKYIREPEQPQKKTRSNMYDFQQFVKRWVCGEWYIWNNKGGNHNYSAYIGDPPKDITEEIQQSDMPIGDAFKVYVTAHKLENEAEVLSIAILPKIVDSKTKISIIIPSRWGASDIPTPADIFSYFDGGNLDLSNQGFIIYGRRLQLDHTPDDFRPTDEKYQGPVNPNNDCYKIYDNLVTADLQAFIPAVLKTYGDLMGTELQCNLLWGTSFGANRMLADLAKDHANHAPFVLMTPHLGLGLQGPHWNYLDSYMGIEHEEGKLSPITREEVIKSTDILMNAKNLPEVPGRKVLILGPPTISFYPKDSLLTDEQCTDLKGILEGKGYDVTLISPDYCLQEWPIPGFRLYPELHKIPEAIEWFNNL